MSSIRRYLTSTLALVLVAVATLSLVAAYFITHHEMEEILDAQLSLQGRIVSALVDPQTPRDTYARIARHLDQPGHPARWYGDKAPDDNSSSSKRYHHEERMLSVGVWNADGSPWLLGAEWNDAGPFPGPDREGYRWQEYGGQRWRVFSLPLNEGQSWLSIGLSEDFHDELSRKVALADLLPMLIALPVLLVLMGMLIHRGLEPIARLSRQVKGRGARDLSHIELAVPRELVALRDAFNDFMSRLSEALERERRFTADAAHELRTPLAALKIHLDNAMAGEQASLRKAYDGIERLQRVVDQLLILARLDSQRMTLVERLDLRALVLELAAELWPLAEAHAQKLEVRESAPLWVEGDTTELGILIRNLLDNALRYTPDGGRVEVALGRDERGTWLSIRDTGPGIPEELLEAVTERFRRVADQRISGSGLGLSIAVELAKRQQAQLTLRNRQEGGLEARLEWES
ncbi:two-component sensor histidine kinase [Litchfieldella qijiaojingensis]|uniref:histidine kinase n=1 Tax=Litchfieldella qijiaojingensis TaxID=980347 RepID=A0ABQ2YDR3_9GAMM|nr:ATP-binding protein [Halomonas qijiaojingensis]GGX81011.1 two-component sensor histidine kinase [Halomonas qijiaojingensis]